MNAVRRTEPETKPAMKKQPERIPFDRLMAVDLRSLSKEQMRALTAESMRRGCPMSELLGALIEEMSRRIVTHPNHHAA